MWSGDCTSGGDVWSGDCTSGGDVWSGDCTSGGDVWSGDCTSSYLGIGVLQFYSTLLLVPLIN